MSKKPAWAMGYALRQAGVPCAEAVAMMLAKVQGAHEPLQYYLYGTPAMKTLYNGVEAPVSDFVDLDPWFRLIRMDGSTPVLYGVKSPVVVRDDGLCTASTETSYNWYVPRGATWAHDLGYSHVYRVLTRDECDSIVWSEKDIFTADGTLFIAGSDPQTVPADGNLILRAGGTDVSYNGVIATELPKVDTTIYPCLYVLEDRFVATPYELTGYTGSDRYGRPQDFMFGLRCKAGTCTTYLYAMLDDDGKFGEIQSRTWDRTDSTGTGMILMSIPVWCSTDTFVGGPDLGTPTQLLLTATSPVELSAGLVDYVNDVPIYE